MATAIVRDDRWFVLAVLLAGIALRLLWFSGYYGDFGTLAGGGEAARVAFSLAQHGSYADAYFAGSGPTAHVLPPLPLAAGALLWLFGPGSGASNAALLIFALAQTAVAYLLVYRLFAALDFDRASLRWAWILLNILPLWVHQETVDFRFWEGAAGLAFAAANLLLLARWRNRASLSWRSMIAVALLCAVTMFVSPAAGVGAGACWVLFALTRLSWPQIARFAGFAAVALVLIIGPWAWRNSVALGEPIALRSNFGLEFALGNHPRALEPQLDPASVYADRMSEIHPFFAHARPAFRQAGGEVAYSRSLGQATWRWAKAHPAQFLTLVGRHFVQFFVPQPWQMYFTGWEAWREPRAWMISAIDLIGLAWLVAGVWRRRVGFAMLGTYVFVTALPYALVQPVPRYSYLVFALLAFLAADAARQLANAASVPGTAR